VFARSRTRSIAAGAGPSPDLFLRIALDWLYGFIPNYGVAIIVLTSSRAREALLMMNQMRSAEDARSQPRMKALQERQDDRQRQSEELMKLYRGGHQPAAVSILLQFGGWAFMPSQPIGPATPILYPGSTISQRTGCHDAGYRFSVRLGRS
jgi:hypothetical protein